MTAGNVLIAIVVIAAVAAGVLVVLWGGPGKPPDRVFKYESEDLPPTDPALIHYKQVMEIQTPFKELRAVAVLRENETLYVAGDKAVLIFDGPAEKWSGVKPSEMKLDAEPMCLAVDVIGMLYVGMKDHVETYWAQDRDMKLQMPPLGAKADIRSIGVTPDGKDIFVADGGNAWVVHYDHHDVKGKIVGYIGRDEKTGEGKFRTELLQCFGMAVGADSLVRVVDPQGHAIETYTLDGKLQTRWEKPMKGIDGFHGCCNPTNIAVMPDGNIVASEKGGGLPRIKVYDPNGNLLSVVAGPGSFKGDSDRVDVAVDRAGRIIAIDPTRKTVRVFEKIAQTQPAAASKPEPATRK